MNGLVLRCKQALFQQHYDNKILEIKEYFLLHNNDLWADLLVIVWKRSWPAVSLNKGERIKWSQWYTRPRCTQTSTYHICSLMSRPSSWMVFILKSIPIVVINEELNESSAKRSIMEVYRKRLKRKSFLQIIHNTLPAPLSPISNSFIGWLYPGIWGPLF
jgi:hypothetical protein